MKMESKKRLIDAEDLLQTPAAQFDMTAKELAAMITGREYGDEIAQEEINQAAEAGLVVVYGYSDDNVELRGAIDDEVECYNGGIIRVTKSGVLWTPDCGQDDCPYFAIAKRNAKTIFAKWHDEGNPCWSFEIDIPHETFKIFEDGELFCIGIVFSVEDLP